jgi:hypothetical protein
MKSFVILSMLLCFSFVKSQSKLDSLKTKFRNFELSFGQSLLFISNSKQTNIINNEAIVIPTSAILFSAEFRPDKFIRIPVFLNLATESKQFLVNGQLINEKASPTLGTGALFKAFQIKLDEKSKLEFEIGPLASFLFDTKNSIRVAPIIAGRIKILRGENFIMYIGTSYSFGINALGLLYGTGTSF